MATRTFLILGVPVTLALLTVACDQVPSRPANDSTTVRVVRGNAPPTEYVDRQATWSAAISAVPAPRATRDREKPHIDPAPSIAQGSIDTWRDRWPVAAHDLDDWAKRYPDAADHLFAWDTAHDERAESLIEWAVGNPYEGFDAFLFSRHGWDETERVMHQLCERTAVRALLEIIRRSPNAWLELAHHPRGLAWVGEHSPFGAAVAQPQTLDEKAR